MQTPIEKIPSRKNGQLKTTGAKSKSLVPVPVALKCPGCEFQTEWRHDYAMHLSKCDQAQVIIHPKTPTQYLAQFLRIPTAQAKNVVLQQYDRQTNPNVTYTENWFKRNASLPLRSILHNQKQSQWQPPYPDLSVPRPTLSHPHQVAQNPQMHLRPNLPSGLQYQRPFSKPTEAAIDLSVPPSEKNKTIPLTKVNSAAAKNSANQPAIAPDQSSRSPTKLPLPTAPIFACTHCSFRTDMQEKMEVHIRKHDFVPPPMPNVPTQVPNVPVAMPIIPMSVPRTFTCNHCPFRTSSELCMVRHLLSKHRSQLLPRSKMTNNNSNSVGKVFSCSFCNYSTTEAQMVDHMLHHYKNHPPCGSCSSCRGWEHPFKGSKQKQVKGLSSRKPAQQSSTSIPPNQPSSIQSGLRACTFCGKQFAVQGLLQAHILSEHMNTDGLMETGLDGKKHQMSSQNTDDSVNNDSPHLAWMKSGATYRFSSSSSKACSLPTPPSSDGEFNEVPDASESSFVPTVVFDLVSVSSEGSTHETSKLPVTVKDLADVTSNSEEKTTGLSETLSSENKGFESSTSHTEPTNRKRERSLSPELILKDKATEDKNSPVDARTSGVTDVDDPLSPTKKKLKLGLIIFRNISGEYESQRIGTPAADLVGASHQRPMLADCQINKAQQNTNIAGPLAMDYQRMSVEIHHSLAQEVDCDKEKMSSPSKTAGQSKTRKPVRKSTPKKVKDILSNENEITCDDQKADTPSSTDPLHSPSISHSGLDRFLRPKSMPFQVPGVPEEDFISVTPKLSAKKSVQESEVSGELEMEVTASSEKPSTEEGLGIQAKSKKQMAELLRSKLSNIDLKNKSRQSLDSTPSPSNNTLNISQSPKLVGSQDLSPKKPSAGFLPGEFIDLTLEDTDDEHTCEQSANVENVDTNCRVNIERLISADIKQELAHAKEAPAPPSSVLETLTADFNISSHDTIVSVHPQQSNSYHEQETEKLSSTKPTQVNGKHPHPIPTVTEVKSAKKSKVLRRRDKFLAQPSVFASASSSSVSALDEGDMVICPYCPKRLLYRLLPAHVQFHGSNCEHQCKECDFATSFKWVLDTHITCHKDIQRDGRQITEEEWLKIKHGMNLADEDIELAQKLIIKDTHDSFPTTPTKQTARKTASKKGAAVNLAASQGRRTSASSVTSSDDTLQPVAANIRQAMCTDDLFNRMISDVRKKS